LAIHVSFCSATILPARPSLTILIRRGGTEAKSVTSSVQLLPPAYTHVSTVDVSRRTEICLQLRKYPNDRRPHHIERTTPVISPILDPDVYPIISTAEREHGQLISYAGQQRERSLELDVAR
jgi:hypothetical protein